MNRITKVLIAAAAAAAGVMLASVPAHAQSMAQVSVVHGTRIPR